MDGQREEILRRRAHGLYLSREAWSLEELSRELLGMHCWFHRNVAFSAAIRGAGLTGWKNALTKTWLYRGTLHGAVYEELPLLLSLHADAEPWAWFNLSREEADRVARRVVMLMEDGVYSRAQMREIFAGDYDAETVGRLFSPWGGIFVYLARHGQVAFRNMTSRDFDLIDAGPLRSAEEVLPDLLRRYFRAYGPASLADAAWFFGLSKEQVRWLEGLELDDLSHLDREGERLYYCEAEEPMGEIPAITILSGFDPYLVSYVHREEMLPKEYRKAVILKSGICLPTVAIDGQVAGLWNLKKGEPTVEFFTRQPKRVQDRALELVEEVRWRTAGQL